MSELLSDLAEEQRVNESLRKPPIGIKTRMIWVELRVLDLLDAIKRYVDEGEKVPAEWVQELSDHLSWRGLK